MIKKQLILEKALELFAKQGFKATSVQQITEQCGISKGAFYLSFKSKDELILALIDHFMMQVTSDIDHLVRTTNNDEHLLYEFYYTWFNNFYKHTNFAKIFIKEQRQSVNEELISKMKYYNKLNEKSILSMIERLYGEEIKQTRYDLLYCIKAFMSAFSELFFFYNIPLDLNLLSQSLVEKTNILARQTTSPFISEELIQMFEHPINEITTKEQILEIMEQKIEEMEESIEKESLILLKQQLLEPTLPPALVKGLLENIRNHPHCKWISYLLHRYYEY